MIKSLTVRELLGCGPDKFDPMSVDTSEIRELSDAMPKDGNIDINNAEIMATKYLRGADMCSELLAIATAYVAKSDSLKKKAHSIAFLVKASEKGFKTDKSRASFADQDDDFITASDRYSEAIAFAKWVNGKYESFSKMHYLCKRLLERGYTHERMASFNIDPEKMVEEANKKPAW